MQDRGIMEVHHFAKVDGESLMRVRVPPVL